MKILITESQLKYLIVEAQQITVIDACGKRQQYDYQQWWYNGGQTQAPYTSSYTWNGAKYAFLFDFNKDPEYKGLSQEQRNYKLRIKCSGQYTKNENLIGLAVKDIKSFSSWLPQTIQEWVDWITWFLESFGGPQGKIIAAMAEAIQGVGYLIFAGTQKTLKGYVENFIEGVSKLFSVVNIKIKIPGLSDWLDRIVKYVEGTGFSSILSRLTSNGAKINTNFDSQPKWLQAVITLLVQATGIYVSQGIKWVINNMLTPLYNLIKQYNTALADYIKGFIDYMSIFLSLVDTASLIVTDLNEKGILTKVTKS